MRQEILSTRIDHDTKAAFTDICEALGLLDSKFSGQSKILSSELKGQE